MARGAPGPGTAVASSSLASSSPSTRSMFRRPALPDFLPDPQADAPKSLPSCDCRRGSRTTSKEAMSRGENAEKTSPSGEPRAAAEDEQRRDVPQLPRSHWKSPETDEQREKAEPTEPSARWISLKRKPRITQSADPNPRQTGYQVPEPSRKPFACLPIPLFYTLRRKGRQP